MPDPSIKPTAEVWIAALRHSHERLSNLVAGLTPGQLELQAYPTEWSIAQVLSHIGSHSEIFGLYLQAGLDGTPEPGAEVCQPIWDTWNAKPPQQQATDALVSDAAFVARLEALGAAQISDWQLELFGSPTTVSDLSQMKLSEHAVHSWDIAVALNPDEAIAQESVDLIIDTLAPIAGWSGKPVGQPVVAPITTHDPIRHFVVRADDAVELETFDHTESPLADRVLRMPAEAFIRLVYGRLDPDHTPALDPGDVDLDQLRRMFPGV
jgi:uncharacterized protein (TIGR03083 family)